jgi:hypothetical protein
VSRLRRPQVWVSTLRDRGSAHPVTDPVYGRRPELAEGLYRQRPMQWGLWSIEDGCRALPLAQERPVLASGEAPEDEAKVRRLLQIKSAAAADGIVVQYPAGGWQRACPR